MMKLLAAAVLVLTVGACGARTSSDSTTSDVTADQFWAGQATVTIERYVRDNWVCENPRPTDNSDIIFDSWANQRAAHTNLCFQIWKPGVTDNNNPDFWRILNVSVTSKKIGSWTPKTEYVKSIGIRGNNRVYAFNLRDLRKLDYSASVQETGTWEVSFTIKDNDTQKTHVLNRPDGKPFRVTFTE